MSHRTSSAPPSTQSSSKKNTPASSSVSSSPSQQRNDLAHQRKHKILPRQSDKKCCKHSASQAWEHKEPKLTRARSSAAASARPSNRVIESIQIVTVNSIDAAQIMSAKPTEKKKVIPRPPRCAPSKHSAPVSINSTVSPSSAAPAAEADRAEAVDAKQGEYKQRKEFFYLSNSSGGCDLFLFIFNENDKKDEWEGYKCKEVMKEIRTRIEMNEDPQLLFENMMISFTKRCFDDRMDDKRRKRYMKYLYELMNMKTILGLHENQMACLTKLHNHLKKLPKTSANPPNYYPSSESNSEQ